MSSSSHSKRLSIIREVSHPSIEQRHRDERPSSTRMVELQPLNSQSQSVQIETQSLADDVQKTAKGIFFMLFSWITPQIEKFKDGKKHHSGEIGKCVKPEQAKVNHRHWNRIKASDIPTRFRSFVWSQMFWATCFHLISIVAGFLTLTYALHHFLEHINEAVNSGNQYEMEDMIEETNGTIIQAVRTRDRGKAIAAKWFQFLMLFELLRAFSSSATSIIVIRTSIRVQQALNLSIYKRLFQIPKVPENLIRPAGVEVQTISDMIQALPYLIGYALTWFLTVIYCFYILGKSYLLTCVLFCLFIVAHAFIQFWYARPDRTKDVYNKEGFSYLCKIIENHRVFKLFAIENVIQKQILKLKNLELRNVNLITFLHMNTTTLIMFRPIFLTITSVVLVPSIIQQKVSMEDAFKVLIVNYWSVHLPKMFSNNINIIPKAKGILKRLNDFFTDDETTKPKLFEPTKEKNLCLEFRWPRLSRSEDYIPIKKGSKVCVKSSKMAYGKKLLRTISGWKSTEHPVRCSGTIEFMPEVSVIVDDTVKENIVFGREFDQNKYAKVVSLCCLEEFVAKNGPKNIYRESISAGETQRISIARTLYSDADIFIFEDFLSYLDSVTALKICTNLKQDHELMKKTFVYCSNYSQEFYFKKHENIFIDDDGFYVDMQEPEDLSRAANFFILSDRSLVRSYKLPNRSPSKASMKISPLLLSYQRNMPKSLANDQPDSGLSTAGKISKIKSTSWAIKHEMFNPSMYALLILHILLAVFYSLANISFHFEINDFFFYFLYFIALLFSHYLLTFIFCCHSNKRLKRFYQLFLSRFCETSLEFIEKESNASLRMMFSEHFSTVEISILNKINGILFRAVGALTLIFSIYFIILLPFPQYWEFMSHNDWMKASVALSILISALVYPIIVFGWIYWNFTKFHECLKWLVQAEHKLKSKVEGFFNNTVLAHDLIYFNQYLKSIKPDDPSHEEIRKDKPQPWWIEKFYYLSDRYQGANWLLESMTHWLNIRIDIFLIGYMIILWMFGVYFLEELGEAHVILLVIFAIITNYFLQFVLTNLFPFNNNLGSFRQIVKYREAMKPFKEAKDFPTKNPTKEYFLENSIKFSNVSMTYPSRGTKLALDDVSFEIKPQTNVCISGPTGAGKTSIINAIFRLFAYEGEISIGNTSITSFELSAYRSIISIIPQKPELFFPTLRGNIDPEGKYQDEDIINLLNVVGYFTDLNLEESRSSRKQKSMRDHSNDLAISDSETDTDLGDSNANTLLGVSIGMDQIDLDQKISKKLSTQRVKAIYLAKALLDRRPIVIMDEFPKRLFNKVNIFKIIKRHFTEQTLIFITHLRADAPSDRLSATQNDEMMSTFAQYIVFKDGKICPEESEV